MRQLVQKLGRLNIVILITIFSVLVSVLLTFIVFYLRQDYTNLYVSISIAIIVPLIVAPLASWPLATMLMKIDGLEKEMRELATYDSLTGLLNRRAFFHNANKFIYFAEREQMPFSVIALDLDKFKNINDSYGHSAGDEVLKHFGKAVNAVIRKGDLIGRIGGEEFALLLPNASENVAIVFSERLHSIVRESTINHDQSLIKYSISMGLVSLLPNKTDNIESILKKADKSLYLAKEKGKNCTVVFNADKAN